MDLNAEVDNLVKASQAWIPMMHGIRQPRATGSDHVWLVGWWLINKADAQARWLVGAA